MYVNQRSITHLSLIYFAVNELLGLEKSRHNVFAVYIIWSTPL